MSADRTPCPHTHTRPATVDDPRPFCVACLTILELRAKQVMPRGVRVEGGRA